MIVNKIGIEKEFWLIDVNGNLIEPNTFKLPHDEFGFLVELRTLPHRHFTALDINFNIELHQIRGLIPDDYSLLDEPRRHVDSETRTYYATVYQWWKLKDTTANIHSGVMQSHATGIDGDYGTAGLHIHFSRYADDKRYQLPIVEIVKKMDTKFDKYIRRAKRFSGEFEIKPYGFEYRSLPANAPIDEVVPYAFFILNKVK